MGAMQKSCETVLGHVQRGGSPLAFDRIPASLFGVHAFELAARVNSEGWYLIATTPLHP